jgi:hypothetical protein
MQIENGKLNGPLRVTGNLMLNGMATDQVTRGRGRRAHAERRRLLRRGR